jgi:Tfp pilus assembly PilM family ATPase
LTLFTTQQPLLGIDINPSYISIVQCQKRRRDYQLQYIASKEVSSDLFHDGKIQDWDLLKSLLLPLLDPVKKTQTAAISLSSQLVRIQKAVLPYGLSPSEIENEIYQNMQRDLPGMNYPLYVDYLSIPREEPGYTDVHFIAARQEYITNYINCLAEIGFQAKVIDVDIYALKNALNSILPVSHHQKEINTILYFSSDTIFLFVYNSQGMIIHHQFFHQEMENKNPVQMKSWMNELCQTIENDLSNQVMIVISPGCRHEIVYQSSLWLDQNKALVFISPSFSELILSSKNVNPSRHSAHHDYLIALGLAMRESPRW